VVKKTYQISVAFMLVVCCLYSAKFIVAVFNLTIPASLLAMLYLIALLHFGIIQPSLVASVATPILKYMALFFVPAGVGILQYTALLTENLYLLLCTLVLVPTIGLVCVGFIANQGKGRD
jgi:holin-like protein